MKRVLCRSVRMIRYLFRPPTLLEPGDSAYGFPTQEQRQAVKCKPTAAAVHRERPGARSSPVPNKRPSSAATIPTQTEHSLAGALGRALAWPTAHSREVGGGPAVLARKVGNALITSTQPS